jgi:hypothetical protein
MGSRRRFPQLFEVSSRWGAASLTPKQKGSTIREGEFHETALHYLQSSLGVCHVVKIHGGGRFFSPPPTEIRDLLPDTFLRLWMFCNLPEEPS